MRILLVITGLRVGGAERQILDLADRLQLRGHVVQIAFLIGPVLLRPVSSDINIVDLGVTRSPLGFWRGLQNLKRLLKHFKPDVVHSNMVHANLLARFARLWIPMRRLVCTAHNTYEGGFLRMLAYRITDRWADISTNVSQDAVNAFEKKGAVPPGRMVSVSNGIDVIRFCFDAKLRSYARAAQGVDSQPVILAVGRMVDAKDYPNLLHAFAIVHVANPRVQLWIAGDGVLRNELENLVVQLELQNCVQFLGVRHDIPALMCAADIFVLPSAWEGFGLVVGEAMACERFVVTTDCGGTRELLGDCGVLVPPCSAQALAEGILKVLEMSPIDAAVFGQQARQRIVEHFSLDAAVSRWEELYATK